MINKYKTNIYKDGIYEIENFISEYEADQLLSFVNLDGDENWFNSHPGSTISVMNNDDMEKFRVLSTVLKDKISFCFKNLQRCIDMMNIRRLKSGEYMHEHKDLGPNNDESQIVFGIVLYLNNEFEGGEIYYKDFDLKIAPKKGNLIIHKSIYSHEVLKINKGERYCMTTFIIGNDETEFRSK